MPDSTQKFQDLLRRLISVIRKERRAITEHAFEKIVALTQSKHCLLQEFDDLVSTLENENVLESLREAIDELRSEADENARRLGALRNGVQRARERLKSIADSEFDAGAYRKDGASLKTISHSNLNAQL